MKRTTQAWSERHRVLFRFVAYYVFVVGGFIVFVVSYREHLVSAETVADNITMGLFALPWVLYVVYKQGFRNGKFEALDEAFGPDYSSAKFWVDMGLHAIFEDYGLWSNDRKANPSILLKRLTELEHQFENDENYSRLTALGRQYLLERINAMRSGFADANDDKG